MTGLRTALVGALQIEWLKQRRSLALLMVVSGAFFTPLIILVVRLLHADTLPRLYAQPEFWLALWRSAWESAAIFFLPMGAVMATSLIVQIEYRNNGWKLVRTLPLHPATVFAAKLLIVLVMLAEFLLLFLIGLWCTATIPAWVLPGVTMPAAPMPIAAFLGDLGEYFRACLPIVTLQYGLSLHFRNFIVPLGIGFLLWVGSLAALSSAWGALSPYAYTMIAYLQTATPERFPTPAVDPQTMALAYTLLFLIAGYVRFATRAQKG